MTWTPTKYRYIDFIGGNILDASNVSLLQAITEGGVASSDVAIPIPGLAQLYQPGTLLNAVFIIAGTGAGTSITLAQANGSYPVYVLVNDRFEALSSLSIAGSQPTSGTHDLYLNWSWDKVTSITDASFIDGITGEATIEAGQLTLDVDWTDTHGAPSGSQFAKNSAAIVLAIFDFDAPTTTTVTYINGVFPYAEGNPEQAGLVELTDTSGKAVGTTDPRTYDARPPATGSVYSSSVATKLQTGIRSSSLLAWLPSLAAPGAQVLDSHGNVQTCLGTSVGPAFASPLPVPPHIPVTLVTDLVAVTTGPVYTLGDWNTIAGGITLQAISNNAPYSSLSWSWRNDGTAGTPAYDPAAFVAFTLTGGVTVTGNTAVYTGGITGSIGSEAITGAGNALAGLRFNIAGFTNAGNNGFEMLCTASSATYLTFINPYGVTESTPTATATLYQGGISSDDILYKTQQESLTAYLDSLATIIAGGGKVTSVFSRTGDVIAQSGDYTASQVGAAPASHVGTQLGLGTSHPASVTSDTGGFSVQEGSTGISGDAYTLSSSTSTRKAAITHSGDLYSLLANAADAEGKNGMGGAATYRGTLGLMSLIAHVLAEHVNYNTSPNTNPHGLIPSDIGAASETYVNNTVAGIIADVMAYTDAKSNISVRTVTIPGTAFPNWPVGGSTAQVGVYTAIHNASLTTDVHYDFLSSTITYVIVNIGGGFEIAFGFGQYATGQQVALPGTDPSWTSSSFYCTGSPDWMLAITYDTKGLCMKCYIPSSTRIVEMYAGADDSHGYVFNGIAGVTAIAWRFITPGALIVSSFDTTANTFNQGSHGDTVQITGRNFGSAGTVQFYNGQSASVSGYSSTSIVCTVPAGATSGVLTVTPAGGSPATSPFVFTIV